MSQKLRKQKTAIINSLKESAKKPSLNITAFNVPKKVKPRN